MLALPWRVGAPTSGKSWICYWLGPQFHHYSRVKNFAIFPLFPYFGILPFILCNKSLCPSPLQSCHYRYWISCLAVTTSDHLPHETLQDVKTELPPFQDKLFTPTPSIPPLPLTRLWSNLSGQPLTPYL